MLGDYGNDRVNGSIVTESYIGFLGVLLPLQARTRTPGSPAGGLARRLPRRPRPLGGGFRSRCSDIARSSASTIWRQIVSAQNQNTM